MAAKSGRFASVKLATSLITLLGEWSVDMDAEQIDVTSFGDGWGQFNVGMCTWTAALKGFFDPSDANQTALITAYKAGSLLTSLRLYPDSTSYWGPKYTTTGGAYITKLAIGATKNGVASIACSFAGVGEISYY